jgi:subtilisin family serine protease
MQDAAAVPGKQYAHELLKTSNKSGVKLAGAVSMGIIDTEVTNASSLNLAQFKSKRMFPDSDKPAAPDHGNAVAAIMAATGHGFEGLAQGGSLRAAGVMREVAPGINATNTLIVAQALDWMVGEKVQVVNLSLGSASDAVLAAVVSKALSSGIVLVAAAGNGGPSAAPSYPAAYPGVIAVTAVDAQKRLYVRANRGTYVAIAAPGVDVWVPVAADGSKGKYMSGTSFASPFVAAAIAQSLTPSPSEASKNTAATQLQKLCGKASNIGLPGSEAGCGLLQM